MREGRRRSSVPGKGFVYGLLAIGLAAAACAHAAPAPAPAPAGIGSYSYVELRGIDWGDSRYFGAAARGEGIKFSYRWGAHAYVTGQLDRLNFDPERLQGRYDRTGVAIGLEGTAGKVSAFLQAGFYRVIGSGTLDGARSYYWEIAYGNRIALDRSFALVGEVYSDVNPEFGSRPYGLKFGVAATFGPATVQLLADHNPDVNALEAALRFAF